MSRVDGEDAHNSETFLCFQPVACFTVKPPIMDTLKSGQPPYNGHTVRPLPIVHTFLPPKKGQHRQNSCPQLVHYSEVPLYIVLCFASVAIATNVIQKPFSALFDSRVELSSDLGTVV